MPVLNDFAQLYALSWIMTISLLAAPLAVFLVREARQRSSRSISPIDTRFRQSLLLRLLLRLGVEPERYGRSFGRHGLAQQLKVCESCRYRQQCIKDLSAGQASLARCPNAGAIAAYFAGRVVAA
ncbi:hypothetical protein [Algiphilus aromaticivorans]|uniref:hypothetical protein n=1 Tax=Algiphilus aromaticivorans TaxID=382454 RepID=UPI0005C2031C|nr:hypothetical protein [Algiphilus aromaticivorans]